MGKRLGIILLMVGLAGCFGAIGSAPKVGHYVLEYVPPAGNGGPAIEEVLTVDRFSADSLYADPVMVYRSGPYLRDAYHERRWRVTPAEMAADFLRRDLRSAGLFRAVLTPRDGEDSRFVLEGRVEEFLEMGEGAGRMARLAVAVTLLDHSRREIPGRILFQKTYRYEAPFRQEGAAGLAEAMSRAMSRLSAQLIADMGDALKRSGR